MKGLVVLCLALLCVYAEERKRYDGYQLFRVYPRDSMQADYVYEQSGDSELDFWYEGRDRFDILVPPHKVDWFKDEMNYRDVPFEVANTNLQVDIDVEHTRLASRLLQPGQAFNYDDFNTFDDILTELTDLANRCPPGSMCETFDIGSSHEGRPLRGLRIWRNGAGRKAVWLDATIHAREWLSTATLFKIIKHLVDDFSDANVANLLETYDFWLVPVSNPDGYSWSWTNDRMQRKNRSPNPGSTCVGTDLNRNYDQMWGNAGAATAFCSETYRGSVAASEIETQHVQAALRARASSLLTSVHFHTYGQLWLMPWGSVLGNGQCNYATDDAEMLVIANAAANAVQATYGTTWARGNSCATIYPASGITMDYSKGVGGVKYTFTPELRGGSFIVAAAQIQPSYVEVWNGVLALIRAIEQAQK